MKSFEEFLKSNKIEVTNGLIKIEDAHRVVMFQAKYEKEKAKEEGLPASLKKDANTVIIAAFEHMERRSQDPEKFGCKLVDSNKNYDDDTWSGSIEGTVQKVWDWALAESGLDVQEIVESLEWGLENQEGDEGTKGNSGEEDED